MNTACLTLPNEIADFSHEEDSADLLDADAAAEMSVVRTPKTTLIALAIAIAAGVIAYQQSPRAFDHNVHRPARSAVVEPTSIPFDPIDSEDHWATADAAVMPLELDG
jgi:hypothetical protein